MQYLNRKKVHVFIASLFSVVSRGQISIDYDREFPSAEVGPRLLRRCSQVSASGNTKKKCSVFAQFHN